MFADATLAKRLQDQIREFYREFATTLGNDGFVTFGGTDALFAGDGSPLTQASGLLAPDEITLAHQFFTERGASWEAVLNPFCHPESLDGLAKLNPTTLGWENILYLPLSGTIPSSEPPEGITIEVVEGDLLPTWTEVGKRAFFGDSPNPIAEELGAQMERAVQVRKYLARWNGVPAATATLSLGLGVAALGGGATLPEFRGRGLQSALIQHRLSVASPFAEIATLGARPGSASQRNAERHGFQIAYSALSLKVSHRL